MGELDKNLRSEEFLAELQTLKLSADEASSVFRLLDVDGEGVVPIEDFVLALLRFNGAASHVDIATLLYESKRNSLRWTAYMEYAAEHFKSIETSLHIVNSSNKTLHAHLAAVGNADVLGMANMQGRSTSRGTDNNDGIVI